MAQASTQNKDKDADENAPASTKTREEIGLDLKLLGGFNEYLRHYTPPKEHAEPDTLQKRFRIDLSAPLPQFNTGNAAAYAVSDTVSPGRRLFAQICNYGSTPRMRVIEKLSGVEHRAILPLVAFGNVELSTNKHERFAIIYEYPAGKTIAELIAEKKIPLNHQFICEHILAPIIAAIQEFSAHDISHGMINADNVYFDERAVIGPCVSEPCGASQVFYAESVERMQALKSAKGEGSVAQDYYALAVMTLHMLHGPDHFKPFTKDLLIQTILKEGAYNTLMRGREVPEFFYDFFRGTLTHEIDDRWDGRQLKSWVDGKRYNVLPPPPPIDAMRPFEFGDKSASTRREVAHFFSIDWDKMIVSLQNRQLAHWVAVSLRNKDLADAIGKLGRTVVEVSARNETQTYELLMHIVMLLDPQGPIRIHHISMHVDGLDTMCAEMHLRQAHQELQMLASFIETNLITHWLNHKRVVDPTYEPSSAVNAIILKLERLRTYIRNSGFGFGLERMLYDLNPTMPCLSPLLADSNITTLPALLRYLDRKANTLAGEEMLDRHIAAFILAKLGVQHEIRLQDMVSIPGAASNRTIMALYLLGVVQSKFDDLKLPGLTHWLSVRLMPLLDDIHSTTLRKKLKQLIGKIAPLGYVQKISEIVFNADYVEADIRGFQQAMTQYRKNANEIASLQNPARLQAQSEKTGLFIATVMAYGLFCLSIMFILRGVSL